jgi:hypothetical protein
LQEAHPNLYEKYYSEGLPVSLSDLKTGRFLTPHHVDALAEKASALSLDQQQKLEKEAAKKEAKAEAKADAEAKKRQVRERIDVNANTHGPNIR